MGQGLRDRLHAWCGHKVVLVLRNVLRDLNCVFANRPKRCRYLFSAVTAHEDHLEMGWPACGRHVRPTQADCSIRCRMRDAGHEPWAFKAPRFVSKVLTPETSYTRPPQ